MKNPFDSIEAVVADLKRGKMVIVVDDADRENEGDLVMAAQFVTPAAVNFMAKHGRGLICVPTTSERLQQLGIERMVKQNRESVPHRFSGERGRRARHHQRHQRRRPRENDLHHGLADRRAGRSRPARPRFSAARQIRRRAPARRPHRSRRGLGASRRRTAHRRASAKS